MEENKRIDTLYRMYVRDLFSYALNLGFDRDTSMDAIHDVFCKICADKKLPEKIANPRFYLLRAMKNRLLDLYKLRKEIPGLSPETLAEEIPFTVQVTMEDRLIEQEEQEKIRLKVEQLLGTLTDRQREIIYLRYTLDCDYEEIAQLMHITLPGCRKLFHNAIVKLRKNPSFAFLLLFLIG
ncbi:MAG: sigma-70 family RNA polymerase sigma factor [Tannerellaceae bacterium]|nr:sigma-70 family RNA polymerase sigma factor [Tannerellaceae bacterium]